MRIFTTDTLNGFRQACRRPTPPTDDPDRGLVCARTDLGPVSLRPAGPDDPADRQAWASMLATHHPVGICRAPGGPLRQGIESAVHGVLDGLGFGAAGLQLAPHDQWIGWSAEARMAHIGQVLCHHRFLI